MRKKAFTLIELLVVIVIIGILAMIIILALNNARKKAADKAFQDSLAKVAEALEVYRTEDSDNEYPATLTPLTEPGAVARLPSPLPKDGKGKTITYGVCSSNQNYVVGGERVAGGWYYIKDADKHFEDGITDLPDCG